MFNCPNCGAQLDENTSPQLKPLTMWGYFGYQILFSIPIIGFILICVNAFGGTPNVNLRNFARSYFCYVIIVGILTGIIAAIAVAAGAGSRF